MMDIPAIEAAVLEAEDIPLEVLFEDEHLIVINKAAGMAVHPSPGHETGTLVHALLHHCAGSLSGMNGQARPGIVHRLDKDTSGVMLAAKHDVAHRALARQFAKHDLHRQYVALVRGVVRPTVGRVEGAIGRHPVHRVRRAVVPSGGNQALTHYRTLETYGEAATLLACTLETGRTHQIRVHMAHLGHPLLGDKLYGNPSPLKGVGMLDVPRQMLHAAELGFIHPVTGEELAFSYPIPQDMKKVIEFLS